MTIWNLFLCSITRQFVAAPPMKTWRGVEVGNAQYAPNLQTFAVVKSKCMKNQLFYVEVGKITERDIPCY